MKIKSILIAILLLSGCGGRDDNNALSVKDSSPKREEVQTMDRFKVESFGYFNAGYNKNKREILIITDTVTKIQYLSVTGAGTCEMSNHDKTIIEE